MKIMDFIKRLFKDDDNVEIYRKTRVVKTPELPALSDYETRRKELAESSEPINGIFYIYNNHMIPDYYSECSSTCKINPLDTKMLHVEFYSNYMMRKYPDLPDYYKFLPRGRVEVIPNQAMVFIDGCYKNNDDIINQISQLYRINIKINIVSRGYSCPNCINSDNDNF